MADGIEGLHVELHGDGQFVKFQGDGLSFKRGYVTAQSNVHVGAWMLTSRGARAEEDSLLHCRVTRKPAADGGQGGF